MSVEKIDTLVVGGGQAGLAMSYHLRARNVPHLVLERERIAERWRTERWDSLVANGPAWHDRFSVKTFADTDPDGFANKESMIRYFEEFAAEIEAPMRCGVDVTRVTRLTSGPGFSVETSDGQIEARNIVAATGPFQTPVIPPVVPELPGTRQMHSAVYRNPRQLPEGAVLVVGAGSSGAQIADELLRAGREVYLSVGPHDRPPRRYRGKDFCWWLGVLGKWEMLAPPEGKAHVTISVSGANGGATVDFRDLAARGMHLCGMTAEYLDGVLSFSPDLADNITAGDEDYLSLLREADSYVETHELDLPLEPEAHEIGPLPASATEPQLRLDLDAAGVSTIIWATGYTQNFDWLQVDAFDANGKPAHQRGVSTEPGVYFLGLPWLSMRGSSFIWGVFVDAENLALHISSRPQTVAA
ncbi:MAG: NAD(P)/FAD-dependent oxidoreductase [Pseudomonadota bacterium]